MAYHSKHGQGEKIRRKGLKLIWILIAVVIAAVIVIPFVEPLMLETEYTTVTSSDLPSDVGTLRIVYVSDIHKGGFFSQGRVESLVKRINALRPDLVLLGGDYAENSDEAIEFFKQLPDFHVTYAVCAVLGENDRTLPESNLSLLKAAMYSAGVTPIVNDVTPIRIGSGSTIYIAGIDDVLNGKPDLAGVAAQVKQTDFVIFMSHNPSIISDALRATGSDGKRSWYDLGFFGHTHGGQIAGLGRLLGFGTGLADRYVQGWLQENKINMLISRGVGTSKVPIRLFCKPQIHVVTVKSGK